MYVMRCGYCTLTERDIGATMTYGHFKPVSVGGTDAVENIVYSCHACNAYKSDFWPESDSERLLHPLDDDISVHIREAPDGTLIGLTPRGTTHINQIRLNHLPLIACRLERKLTAETREDLRILRQQITEVLMRLDKVEHRPH